MASSPTKTSLFRANPPRSVSKADVTDQAARDIVATETARRQAASARLKALREERDALAAANPEPAPAKKPAKARKAKAG